MGTVALLVQVAEAMSSVKQLAAAIFGHGRVVGNSSLAAFVDRLPTLTLPAVAAQGLVTNGIWHFRQGQIQYPTLTRINGPNAV